RETNASANITPPPRLRRYGAQPRQDVPMPRILAVAAAAIALVSGAHSGRRDDAVDEVLARWTHDTPGCVVCVLERAYGGGSRTRRREQRRRSSSWQLRAATSRSRGGWTPFRVHGRQQRMRSPFRPSEPSRSGVPRTDTSTSSA